ncbi:hypothetical protein F2P56_034740 [Juglans regia]|uniref:Uncharacterized protein LOC108993079 n=2 Tax=Juglans regia TaxID=51240 RepID=A0A2I4EVH8_JUGRE|nr:uncharacterized protein LOC108993079 [Juglans regia]KAF5445709.1 hypothetical protein F2P56_034740 [Juglans regia]
MRPTAGFPRRQSFRRANNFAEWSNASSHVMSLEYSLSLYKEHDEAQRIASQSFSTNFKWHPPPAAVLKLNTNGATFANQSSSGIRVILRDSHGRVLMSVSRKENEVQDSMEIELLAILRGMQLCFPMGIPELIVETDSLLSVQALQSQDELMSMQGNLISAIKELMKQMPMVSIQHVSRLANGAADGLA